MPLALETAPTCSAWLLTPACDTMEPFFSLRLMPCRRDDLLTPMPWKKPWCWRRSPVCHTPWFPGLFPGIHWMHSVGSAGFQEDRAHSYMMELRGELLLFIHELGRFWWRTKPKDHSSPSIRQSSCCRPTVVPACICSQALGLLSKSCRFVVKELWESLDSDPQNINVGDTCLSITKATYQDSPGHASSTWSSRHWQWPWRFSEYRWHALQHGTPWKFLLLPALRLLEHQAGLLT